MFDLHMFQCHSCNAPCAMVLQGMLVIPHGTRKPEGVVSLVDICPSNLPIGAVIVGV